MKVRSKINNQKDLNRKPKLANNRALQNGDTPYF